MRTKIGGTILFSALAISVGCSQVSTEGSNSTVSATQYGDQTEYSSDDGRANENTAAYVERLAYEFYNALPASEKQSYADRNGNCGDVAIIWPQALEDKGLRFNFEQTETIDRLAVSGPDVDLTRADSFLSKTHFFLTVERNGEKVLFDPTYLQFFETVPAELQNKLIFVGTFQELRALYKKYDEYTRLDVAGDTNYGKYDPDQLFDFIYSVGGYDSGRTSFPIGP